MRLRWLLLAVLALGLMLPAGSRQAYRPAAGEVALVVEVEGRGSIVIRMYPDKAPKAVTHISGLAARGFYDGQRFFRVVREPRPFLIQTGDPQSRDKPMDDPSLGSGGSGTRIPYEDSGLANDAGSVGLATKPKDRDSGDSQFYILLSPAKFLDGSYTVFGKVVSGMDVVQAIQLGDKIRSAKVVRG